MRTALVVSGVVAVSLILLWPRGPDEWSTRSYGDQQGWLSFNLLRHGEFRASLEEDGCLAFVRSMRGSPSIPDGPAVSTQSAEFEPYWHRPPGYALYLAAIFSTFPESDLRTWDAECGEEMSCFPPAPLRRRAAKVTVVLTAVMVAGVSALTFFLGGSLTAVFAAGAGFLFWSVVEPNRHGMWTLSALLLLGHVALAAVTWRRPRILTGVLSGAALGFLVLTRAVFQYWIVGVAVVLAVGTWLDAGRRRVLVPACVALVIAALTPAMSWMIRNAVEGGPFGISGRAGETLALRAEYGRMTWSEVRGAFTYWLYDRGGIPGVARTLRAVRSRLEPEAGYINFDRGNPDGYYRRAKQMTGDVAARAERIDPEWLSSPARCDAALQQASIELMRADWLKHVALTPAFAIRGTGGIAAGVLGLAVVPAYGLVLLAAWKRRNVALALVVLPPACVYAFHALLTHFITPYSQPLVPVAFVVCALAADEVWRRIPVGLSRRRAS